MLPVLKRYSIYPSVVEAGKKSEMKMKSIISGGATTILVSHSLAQVRQMCNKILWLNQGEQIMFGEDVKGICDAYEKFMKDKTLPPKQGAK